MKLKLLTLSLVIFAASCVSKEEDSTENTTANETAVTQAPSTPQTTGVSFKTMQGDVVDLSTLSDKVVFLNFWATWCGPCIKEMPSLQALYNKYEGNPNVEFLVVEIDNRPDLAQKFVADHNFTFPIFSPASAVPETMLGQAIPTTVILDKKGDIAYRHEGMSDFVSQDFINLFEGILAK
jgi:thiol-disulfide isomerase/thioredoxin